MDRPTLDDDTAHDLISAILHRGEEPGIQYLRALAAWALDKSVEVDGLRSDLDAAAKRESKCTCGGVDPDEHRPQGVTTWGGW